MMYWQGGKQITGGHDASRLRVAVVAARFNAQVVEPLVAGAFDAWCRLGGRPTEMSLTWVPGAFELPVVAKRLAAAAGQQGVDAVICLGAIVRGDTPHFDYVASQSASGTMQAALSTGVPILFGVLTCDTADQAMARAGGKAGNKGADAVLAAVETAQVMRQLNHANQTQA